MLFAEEMNHISPLLTPVIQYGFGGLSVLLLGVLIWIVKMFVQTMKDTNQAVVAITRDTITEIAKNTLAAEASATAIAASFDKVHDVHLRQLATLQETKDELFKRPCILPKGD